MVSLRYPVLLSTPLLCLLIGIGFGVAVGYDMGTLPRTGKSFGRGSLTQIVLGHHRLPSTMWVVAIWGLALPNL